jgi:branched-chain amino acid transport system substrate-binding protein
MKKGFAFLALVAATGVAFSQAKDPAGGVVKIGVSAALSGDAAVYSKPFVNTVVYMADRFNKEGGILGKKVEVVYYDDKGSPSTALDVVKKLVYDDKVSIIQPGSTSGAILTAMPVGKKERLIQFGYGLSDDYIKQGEGMIFRAAPTNQVLLGGLARYAAEELNLKTIGLIHLDSSFGENQRDVFTSIFQQYGGKILLSKAYQEGERDFNAIGSEVVAAKPDGIVIFAQAGSAAAGVKQLASIMPKTMKLLGHNEWANPTTRKLAGEAAARLDAYCSPVAVAINPDPKVQEWVKRIETDMKTPVVEEMMRGIVGMQIIKIAVEKAGSFDGLKVMREIHKLKDVDTVMGNFSYDIRDGEAIKDALIVKPNNADPRGDTVIKRVRSDVALYPTPPNYATYFGANYYQEMSAK